MRKFSAYELNLLAKHGKDSSEFAESEMPVEYIVGVAEFADNEFYIDERALIPRIESELLLKKALEFIENDWRKSKKLIYADVGTGSGALGISFALELIKRQITFNAYLSDIHEDVLELAHENTKKIIGDRLKSTKSKITYIQSDLLSDFNSALKFDIIFANLPYIPSKRIQNLDTSVKDFEPISALDGGEDGAKYIMQFLEQAERFLKKNGVALLEVDDSHNQNFIDTFYNELPNFWNVELQTDNSGKNRFWICKLN